MSDYISKSALIEEMRKGQEVIKDRLDDISVSGIYATIEAVIEEIDRQPTVDEKEIIRKAFERALERLEEKRLNQYSARAEYVSGMNGLSKCYCDVRIETLEDAIEILKEECGISE